MKFLFNNLKQQNSPLAEEFYHALKVRVSERRNQDLVSLMKYLNNKDLKPTSELPLSSKKSCSNLACDLFMKFFDHGDDWDAETETEGSINHDEVDDSADLAKQLTAAVERESEAGAPSTADSSSHSRMKKQLQHELSGYEKNSILGPNLQKILSALKLIQPTSTESERVFSLAGNICSKKRTRLSDRSLNNICFLKSYFLSRKKNNSQ